MYQGLLRELTGQEGCSQGGIFLSSNRNILRNSTWQIHSHTKKQCWKDLLDQNLSLQLNSLWCSKESVMERLGADKILPEMLMGGGFLLDIGCCCVGIGFFQGFVLPPFLFVIFMGRISKHGQGWMDVRHWGLKAAI